MARPRIPIGSYGSISCDEVTPGVWRAMARYRYADGRFRKIERRNKSRIKAINALKAALRGLDAKTNGTISPNMPLSDLGHLFIKDKRNRRTEGTIQTYEVALSAHIIPDIGMMTIREATPERLNNYLTSIAKQHGHGAAKNCRSVLSGMMGMAVRNGALIHNPVSEVERIEKPGKPGSAPIPVERLGEFLKLLAEDESMRTRGFADLFTFMAGTGWRMGEACGLKWSAVDFDNGEVTMCRIAKYIKGKGAVLQEFGKTDASARTIKVPETIMAMLRARRLSEPDNDMGLVFPSSQGGVLDPNNVERALRRRRDAIGFPGVTSHSLRKCVATMLDLKGLSARAIADYLGHSNPSMTQDVYMQRNLDSGIAAEKLEAMLPGTTVC